MKNKWIQSVAILLLPVVFLVSCVKNETKYYSDDDNKGLSVFSNRGNNIFTCYINGVPWQTVNRTCCGIFAGSTSELFIHKEVDSLQSMLVIDWYGGSLGTTANFDDIALYLYIPATFTYQDFYKLQGTRITVDSTTGYFYTNTYGGGSARGTGSVYFNKASFDSTTLGSGRFSGLVEASFSGVTITKGRFDHDLTFGQIHF